MTNQPVIADDATREFLKGTAQGHFLIRVCEGCGAVGAPQAVQCAECESCSLRWEPASGRATLVSWTATHSKPDAAGTVTVTVLAIAELAEGPWWWGEVVDATAGDMAVGAPLMIDFVAPAAGSERIPVFRLVSR